MKIYLAGPCDTENRTIMVKIARALREYGHCEVYCPWELKIENAWDISQEEWARQVFEEDIKAIQECETFIMISRGRISSAGSNWEQGYAFGLGKCIIVIQITKEPTSLMTFCGTTHFFNCEEENNLLNIIKKICDSLNTYYGLITGDNRYYCETVLT